MRPGILKCRKKLSCLLYSVFYLAIVQCALKKFAVVFIAD